MYAPSVGWASFGNRAVQIWMRDGRDHRRDEPDERADEKQHHAEQRGHAGVAGVFHRQVTR